MSSPLSSLLDTAKGLCSGLPVLVPSGLYLPSPPLYCPQPTPNTQVHNMRQLLHSPYLHLRLVIKCRAVFMWRTQWGSWPKSHHVTKCLQLSRDCFCSWDLHVVAILPCSGTSAICAVPDTCCTRYFSTADLWRASKCECESCISHFRGFFVFRSRRSTCILQHQKKKTSSQRVWWSSSPVVDSSDGGLRETWTLIPSKLLVRCHS